MKNVTIIWMPINVFGCSECEGIRYADMPVKETMTKLSQISGEPRFFIHRNALFELSELRIEL